MALLADIYPTLVALAGLPPPAKGIGKVEGTDLSPLILGTPGAVQPVSAYSQVTRCRASYVSVTTRGVRVL